MNKKLFIFISCVIVVFAFACSVNPNHSGEKAVVEKESYYNENYRPQFHFTPEKSWMNDPNGMVYYEGEYHLFYQYYPDSTVWGPMHWGHAISNDLVHWQHLPIAIYPDEHGYIFSGSAVVDWGNTSGLGKNGQPPLIAIFTYHDPNGEKAGENNFQNQGIAFSNDKGRTWEKVGEPVLKNPGIKDFRDPKVMWHADSEKWIMTLAVQDHIEFYSSRNLIEWQRESSFGKQLGAHGGVWECPDLFQMIVEGTEEKQWVLLVSINPGGPNGGSATQYFVGNFDGNKFTTSQKEIKWVDSGRDNYAGVTWSDIPETDGRRLFIGWMSNWSYATVVPTEKWRSAMTIPRELKLVKTGGNNVLVSVPVEELKKIRGGKVDIKSQVIVGEIKIDTKQIQIQNSEMKFEFQLNNNPEFGINLKNEKGESFKIGYSLQKGVFYTDRSNAGNNSFSDNFSGIHIANYKAGETMKIDLFIDEASIEVFIDNGKLVLTDIVFPTTPFNQLELFSTNGNINLIDAQIWNLKSIW